MAEFKKRDASYSKKLGLVSLAVAVVASIVYFITLSGHLFPGESAHLAVQWAGLDTLAFPDRPLWGVIVKWVAGLGGMATLAARLNIFALVCGVLGAVLVSQLVAFFVRETARADDTEDFANTAALVSSVVAAFVFITSTAIWQASTHLDFRLFDVVWALAIMYLFIPAVRWSKLKVVFLLIQSVMLGIGFVESPLIFAVLPLVLFASVVVAHKSGKAVFGGFAIMATISPIVWIWSLSRVAKSFMATPAAESGGYAGAFSVALKLIGNAGSEMNMWFTRSGWLALVILCVLPFVSCLFASVRGLNADRRWSQYLFHFAMTIATILVTATPLSPVVLLQPYGILPVAVTTLSALTAGYLAAYWYLLFVAKPRVNESTGELSLEEKFGASAAPVAGGLLVAVLVLAALVNSFSCSASRGDFADEYAAKILDSMGERQWLVTVGTMLELDDHLRLQAAIKGKPFHLVCLYRDRDAAYRKEIAKLVKDEGLSIEGLDLALSADIGVKPFIDDWLKGDSKITSKVMILGNPDLWYFAGYIPVPDGLAFTGVRSLEEFKPEGRKDEYVALWESLRHSVGKGDESGSQAIETTRDPVERLRMKLRRNLGLVTTDMGYTLNCVKWDDDAFELYNLVMRSIDPDNISAVFNLALMQGAGSVPAINARTEISKRMKAIEANYNANRNRYQFYSLSRYYGYIRDVRVFEKMRMMWAKSGMLGTDASTEELKRELERRVAEEGANDRDTLVRLAQLSMKDGEMDRARELMTKAVAGEGEGSDMDMDMALLHLMDNDLDAARIAMQKMTDVNPSNLQAWSLLAGVILQQHEAEQDAKKRESLLAEIENVILPRMESVAANARDYYVQLTRALVLMRKGPDFIKSARDSLVVASMANPSVSAIGEMILDIDIRLNDTDNAEKHARSILYYNREDKLANYVMGSLRLKDGNYTEAEQYLRKSCRQTRPLAAAENDLAEVLRRLQRSDEAEVFARRAVESEPGLYVAWETLASSLLDQGKNLDEAQASVEKAISLAKKAKTDDIRMHITLARVQMARNDWGAARITLRTLEKRQKDLDPYDSEQVDALKKEMRSGGK